MGRGRGTWGSAVVAATAMVALCGCSPSPHARPSSTPSSGTSAGGSSASASSARSRTPSVTVTGSGDILLHSPLWREAAAYAKAAGRTGYDFDPMFVQVKSAISAADIAICHQETPISSTDADLSAPGSTSFNVPREIAGTLKRAGYDGCDAASNHTMDRGVAGIVSTRRQLQAAGLKVAGPTGAPGPLGIPAMYEAKGVKVADLAFTYTLPNSATPTTHVPSDAPWLKAYLWPAIGASAIIADARAAKKAGADIVIVNIHWGKEGVQHPTPAQTTLAGRLLASPYVDAIFGTHAHVVQPCTTIHGKYVFYGLGNFISNQGPTRGGGQTDSNQDGVLAQITFSKTASGIWSQRARYQPTHVDDADKHTVRLSTPQSDPASWGRTKQAMNALGSCPAVAAGS
ncbi:CapA family protein [Allobranchiibius sp. GilTou73]|uniref:CapA family protein n=1 Tax=Allobranchiibius sp. GilTou73 TaxID=2904523 RepID=UPI001F2CC568|nr:CapA family protein [Allobranchiibius sp. GilTou73]UIJ34480.1 CapA family protein [Allobranchiibius sp. GilTou73]